MIEYLKTFNPALFALLIPVIAFWGQLRGYVYSTFTFFLRTDTIHEYSIFENVAKHIFENSKVVKWGNKNYVHSRNLYLKNIDLTARVLINKREKFLCFYKRKVPLILSEDEGALKITYLLGTFNLDGVLSTTQKSLLMDWSTMSEKESEFQIVEFSGIDILSNKKFSSTPPAGNTQDSLITPTPTEGRSSVLLNPFILKTHAEMLDIKYEALLQCKPTNMKHPCYYWSKESNKLLQEVKFWKESRKWFSDRGIIHKRGVCLFGVPGTGKSKMVLEVAMKMGVSVTKLNLSNMSDDEFTNYYNNAREGIVLIEDIDAIFEGRKNILAENSHHKNLISFDTLINTISGINTKSGKFLVITTNRVETLDPALIRPGRLDVKIEVEKLDLEGMKVVANNILFGYQKEIDKLACKENEFKYTAAEFEQICIETAIEFYWTRK